MKMTSQELNDFYSKKLDKNVKHVFDQRQNNLEYFDVVYEEDNGDMFNIQEPIIKHFEIEYSK